MICTSLASRFSLERLRRALGQQRLCPGDLAVRTGYSRGYVAAVVAGQRAPSPGLIFEAEKALGLFRGELAPANPAAFVQPMGTRKT